MTPTFLTEIVRQTNQYATQLLSTDSMQQHMDRFSSSRYHKWKPITVLEMRCYLGLIFAMGKKTLSNYWSTDAIHHTPFFSKNMSYCHFALTRRMLHLNNKRREIQRGQPGFDPWAKVRLFLDHMNAEFKRHYVPSSNVSIE